MEKATFAAGCFWGVEHKLARVPGVTSSAVGYMGGRTKNPGYQDVCTDQTGHAEVAQVEFDPAKVSFETLVRKFYEIHDPTQLNRQGPDEGSQYRSAIFFHSPEQKAAAEKVTRELNDGRFRGRIVTQIVPAAEFWRAEEYHQKYGEKHPGHHCTL
ncbi:MAG TPA: peptide-methionine (S)-S-oxide reductase MsrA [Candidatus Binatia bacterium]|nr:peptide-methionine (S)-S-oxide reductase MsrA [Candidatus Binatia bacterium]